MMPDGISRKIVLLPLIHKVWPALCPPWKRTTPWADSASQSTILPLPSSPHWVPITTMFLLISSIDCDVPAMQPTGRSENPYDIAAHIRALLDRPNLPFITFVHEFAIKDELIHAMFLARQNLHDDDTFRAQRSQGTDQFGIAAPWRTNRVRGFSRRQAATQRAKIQTEAGGRT